MNTHVRLAILILTLLFVFPLLRIAGQDTSRGQAGPTNSDRTYSEAPAGFDNKTNGYLSQKLFDDFKSTFEEIEDIDDGLGPTFNDTACANCHNTPVIGGSGLKLETRAGTFHAGHFVDHAGGSLVQDQVISTCRANLKEAVAPNEDYTFRASGNILGDGFVEAIADETITQIASQQSSDLRGMVIKVPVLEANGALRVGRFGWKNQHASLESFSADAYLNEMGITSPLLQTENTSDGHSVASCDEVRDPENDGGDVREFAEFVRATKAPPRGSISNADDRAGMATFIKIGCADCHVPTIRTAPVGTSINGGTFTVPPALGDKSIHPFSDFLLHDVGTSDPIVQNGGPDTYHKVRTAPLWGLRTRTQLMHDGQSSSTRDAIVRHGGQGAKSSSAFRALSDEEKRMLMTFLNSL